jgi:hypothetical protein
MTSANVVQYEIQDKNGKTVGTHRQNIMCKTCNDGLEKFIPPEDFTMLPYGYDEEEELWEGKSQNLKEWLSENKAEISFKK